MRLAANDQQLATKGRTHGLCTDRTALPHIGTCHLPCTVVDRSQQGRIRDLSGKRLDHLHGVNLLLLCENGVSVALCFALRLPHQGLQAAHLQSIIHSEEETEFMIHISLASGKKKGQVVLIAACALRV